MKIVLNEKEVKEAIEQYVKNKVLDCQNATCEVLDVLDEAGLSLQSPSEGVLGVSFEVGATLHNIAPISPAAPGVAFPQPVY